MLKKNLGKWLISWPPTLYLLIFFAIPALIMVVVFAAFTGSRLLAFKAMGFGLAAAVLIAIGMGVVTAAFGVSMALGYFPNVTRAQAQDLGQGVVPDCHGEPEFVPFPFPLDEIL